MAFADISADGDRIAVKTEFRDKELIRMVPGARWNPKKYVWEVPLTWASCNVLRGIFGNRLELGDALNKWGWMTRRDFVEPAMKLREATSVDDATSDAEYLAALQSVEKQLLDEPKKFTLYPFQRADVLFLAHARRSLLLNEMGCGKTPVTITTLRTLAEAGERSLPALVVAPNSMKMTWAEEIAKWWPAARVEVIGGSKAKRVAAIHRVRDGEADIAIINWESLRTHSKLARYGAKELKKCHRCDPSLRGNGRDTTKSCQRCPRELNEIQWRSVVIDEAHRAKDPNSQQTRASWAVAQSAEFRYALTGTPIASTPQDLWASLHFLDPAAWPAKTKYIDRWCHTSVNPWGGLIVYGLKPETKDEFFRITDPQSRRMPKSLVLDFLPDKVYTTRFIDMHPKQKKAYDAMEASTIAAVEGKDGKRGMVIAANPLTQLLRLSQFASAYAEVDDEGEVHLSDPSCKIDALLEILDDMDGKPAVVFAQSRQLIALAEQRLEKNKISYELIVGGQTTDERQAAIRRFQDGQTRVVLATVAAGGVGITLTRSDTVIFLQRSWSAIDNSQAEDRCHRVGSEIHDSINIIDIVSQGTVEEKQREVLEMKDERLQEIVRDADLLKNALGIKEGK